GGQYVAGRATGFAAADGRAKAVLTTGGAIPADAVVIAAGAWSRELARMAGDDVPLQTQRGYHVTFPDLLAPLNRPVVAADRKIFVTPLENGLRVAGTVEFDSLDAPPDPARAAALLTGLPDLLPNLAL